MEVSRLVNFALEIATLLHGIADFFFVGFKFGFHGCDAFCHYLHVGHIKIELSSAMGMIFLLCDFFCSRREQIDLIQSLALADGTDAGYSESERI